MCACVCVCTLLNQSPSPLTGQGDKLVQISESQKVARALTANGVESELTTLGTDMPQKENTSLLKSELVSFLFLCFPSRSTLCLCVHVSVCKTIKRS
jgi:hypothetical protein